jgi:hypothetical protein
VSNRLSHKGSRRAAALMAMALVSMVGCGTQTTATAPPLPSASLPAQRLEPETLSPLGARGVGAINCNAGEVAWPTDSAPIANGIVPRRDVVEVVSANGGQPRIVARAQHGGDLDSPVPIAYPWLVYIEYQQHQESSSADFWYLNAVNLLNGQNRELANATSGPALQALPRYDAADGRAVWDQLDSAGEPELRMYDFATGGSSKVGTPAGTFPVNPAISGNEIVYIDNSTDPNSSKEDWLGRKGSLRRYDIPTAVTTTLDADPSAYAVQASDLQVAWFALPPTGGTSVKTVALAGGRVTVIGNYSGIPQTNGSVVVWYDSHAHRFLAFGLGDSRTAQLQVGSWPDPQGPFALCGNRLYFAVAPGYDGGTSTIRFVSMISVRA